MSDISPPGREGEGRRGGREKRVKILVSTDRKAFFSIISLLIDKSLIPIDEIVTPENFESFMPIDRVAYVEKLKELLNYDC